MLTIVILVEIATVLELIKLTVSSNYCANVANPKMRDISMTRGFVQFKQTSKRRLKHCDFNPSH